MTVLSNVFEKPVNYFTEEKVFREIEGWDSFTHISLITQIEDSMGINFTEDEIVEMVRIGDLVRVVGGKRSS